MLDVDCVVEVVRLSVCDEGVKLFEIVCLESVKRKSAITRNRIRDENIVAMRSGELRAKIVEPLRIIWFQLSVNTELVLHVGTEILVASYVSLAGELAGRDE